MENLITTRLERAIADKVFPGAVVGIIHADGERSLYPVGRYTYELDSPKVVADTVYDIASLTKSLAGAAALLKLVDEGEIDLNDRVYKYVPGFDNHPDKRAVTIWHLLTHTLDLSLPSMSTLKGRSADEIADMIIKAPLKNPPGKEFNYVNSTAFFIHLIVEKVTGMTLDAFCQEKFYIPLGMKHTLWRPSEADRKNIPPTEIDAWRGRTVQGEVHDESTYVLQQKYKALAIAGLFSNAPDILTFQEMLLRGGVKDGKHYFSEEIIESMSTAQPIDGKGYPSLGWEMKQPSFMGQKASEKAFAKTGFTGCLMITDPIKKKALVFLSNSPYPQRPTSKDAINSVRRDIADIVFGG